VLEHNLPLDYVYYLEHKVAKALIRAFYHFIKYVQPKAPIKRRAIKPAQSSKRQRTLWGGLVPISAAPKRKVRTEEEVIERKFELDKEKYIHRLLFGSLTQYRPQTVLQEQHGIFQHVKRQMPCEVCSRQSPDSVCSECRATSGQAILNLRGRMGTEKEEMVVRLEEQMKVCRGCLGCETDAEVLCGNTSCPVYFPRRMAQIDARKLQERQKRIKELLDW